MTPEIVVIGVAVAGLIGLGFTLWRVERSRGDARLDAVTWEHASNIQGGKLEDKVLQLKRADESARDAAGRHANEMRLVKRQRDTYREERNAIIQKVIAKHPELGAELAADRLNVHGVQPGSMEDPDRESRDREAVPDGSAAGVAAVHVRPRDR